MPPTISKPLVGVHHLQETGVFLSDEGGLLNAHQVERVRVASQGSFEQDVLDVDEGQAGGDVGEFIRSEFRRADSLSESGDFPPDWIVVH